MTAEEKSEKSYLEQKKGATLLFLNKANSLFSVFPYFCFSTKMLVSDTHALSEGTYLWCETAGAGLTAVNGV